MQIHKLALGTVQFGLDYGINNKRGKIPKDEVFEILDFASESGIDTIDTAQTYGDSEKTIGDWISDRKKGFNIISKIKAETREETRRVILTSFQKLGVESIYGYLLHDFGEFLKYPAIFNELEMFKKEGKIKKLGFSLYYPHELDHILQNKINIDVLQLPYNIFDQRFGAYFGKLHDLNVEVHIRSVFLQGLLFKKPDELNGYFLSIRNTIEKLIILSEQSGISIMALCLSLPIGNKYIDKVVVGIDAIQNLKDICEAAVTMSTNDDIIQHLIRFRINDENIILPFLWNRD